MAHAASRSTGSTGIIRQMRSDRILTPWPGLRQTWWIYTAAVALLAVYLLGLMLRIRCQVIGHCGGAAARLLDLDSLGGLPRLITTGVFLVVVVVAGRAAHRRSGPPARWWAAVATVAAGLAVLKLFSLHSEAKAGSAVLALLVSALLATVTLVVLSVTGRRWGVSAAQPVVLALACYAGAAIGLDAVTSLVSAVQTYSGALTAAAATFVEELGEALTALALLVTVRWQSSPSPPPVSRPLQEQSAVR